MLIHLTFLCKDLHCFSGTTSAMVVLAKNKNYRVLLENELMISGKYNIWK